MLSRLDLASGADPVVLMHDGVGPGARREHCRSTLELIEPLVEALGGPHATRVLGREPVPLSGPWPR